MFGNFIGLHFCLSLTRSFFFLLPFEIAVQQRHRKMKWKERKNKSKTTHSHQRLDTFFFFCRSFSSIYISFSWDFTSISFFLFGSCFFLSLHPFQIVCFMWKRPVHKCLMFNFWSTNKLSLSRLTCIALRFSCSFVVLSLFCYYVFLCIFWCFSLSLSLSSDRSEWNVCNMYVFRTYANHNDSVLHVYYHQTWREKKNTLQKIQYTIREWTTPSMFIYSCVHFKFLLLLFNFLIWTKFRCCICSSLISHSSLSRQYIYNF